jgi:hypothetical protein
MSCVSMKKATKMRKGRRVLRKGFTWSKRQKGCPVAAGTKSAKRGRRRKSK